MNKMPGLVGSTTADVVCVKILSPKFQFWRPTSDFGNSKHCITVAWNSDRCIVWEPQRAVCGLTVSFVINYLHGRASVWNDLMMTIKRQTKHWVILANSSLGWDHNLHNICSSYPEKITASQIWEKTSGTYETDNSSLSLSLSGLASWFHYD